MNDNSEPLAAAMVAKPELVSRKRDVANAIGKFRHRTRPKKNGLSTELAKISSEQMFTVTGSGKANQDGRRPDLAESHKHVKGIGQANEKTTGLSQHSGVGHSSRLSERWLRDMRKSHGSLATMARIRGIIHSVKELDEEDAVRDLQNPYSNTTLSTQNVNLEMSKVNSSLTMSSKESKRKPLSNLETPKHAKKKVKFRPLSNEGRVGNNVSSKAPVYAIHQHMIKKVSHGNSDTTNAFISCSSIAP